MKSRNKYHRRAFLNAGKGSAMIEASVVDDSWEDKKRGKRQPGVMGSVHITDCSRGVHISFYVNNAKTLREALAKADKLIGTLEELRDSLVAEYTRQTK